MDDLPLVCCCERNPRSLSLQLPYDGEERAVQTQPRIENSGDGNRGPFGGESNTIGTKKETGETSQGSWSFGKAVGGGEVSCIVREVRTSANLFQFPGYFAERVLAGWLTVTIL